ncbi:MAG: three-Cys-motif partner protein TcmP [Phycisphaerales bacterium]|nr:three-Cys-motif partner protein TcmP [Phycisphaerales bacterium]
MEMSLYDGREQTLVKHTILRQYLRRFAYIIGSWADAITYIDCFSGPWNARSEELADSSFALALTELRRARDDLAARREQAGRPRLGLRCFFIEKDEAAYKRLSEFSQRQTDVEIRTKNAPLEDSIQDIVAFANASRGFSFVFVDPKGWKGLSIEVIRPLMRIKPAEVLITLMTSFITRFAGDSRESLQESLDRVFGSAEYRRRVEGKVGVDRDDALLRCYSDAVREAGEFPYIGNAIVLHPEKDRVHFHLVYGTRDAKGLEVFKEAEKKAMEVMERSRGRAQQRLRVTRSRQTEMFEASDLHNIAHYTDLRDRYTRVASDEVHAELSRLGSVPYDRAWEIALSHPLVWETDLIAWLGDWVNQGKAELHGLPDRARRPRQGKGHRILWK